MPSTTVQGDQSVSDDPVGLLIADYQGVWLTAADGARTQLVDGAVRWALPDRVGGVLFQRVETGAWRPVQDEISGSTARWRWIGSGTAQPIWRLGPDRTAEVVVDAPSDGRLELVDSAVVDGDPTVAYVRTRYFTVTASGESENPWWDSAIAELVVRDLNTDTELVLRTQAVGWEYSRRTPSLGSERALDVIEGYGGDSEWVEVLAFDGTMPDPDPALPSCADCNLVADLPPIGDALVSARRGAATAGTLTATIEVISADVTSGREHRRSTIEREHPTWPVSIDTVDDRTLVLTARDGTPADRPVLAAGDQGPWVQLVQAQLSTSDDYLVPDGIFGPRTEAGVRDLQADNRLPETGIVDPDTWDRLGAPQWVHDDAVVIDSNGHATTVTATPPGTPVILADRHGPIITLWSGN